MTLNTPNLPHQSTIALDCDGVLLDFLTKWHEIAEYALQRSLPDLENAYDLSARYGLTQNERERVMRVFEAEHGWASLRPLPGAIESAIGLQQLGHRVIVVTSIDPLFEQARLQNLANHGFKPDAIYCVGVHAGHTKGEAFHVEQPRVVVDDRLVYLKQAQGMIKTHHPELVWVNDGVSQHGHIPDFVQHEVDKFSHWAAPLLSGKSVTHTPKILA